MPRSLYALLVGIDDYPSGINRLDGCVNDVEAFAEFLRKRVDSDSGCKLVMLVLKNADATRDAVIGGFRRHLCLASKDDVALFYYAGHGSQEQAPPEFWSLEPDRLDETLVCWDSRLQGKWDLADKELAKLIAEVSDRKPHLAVILDCCHSGSGTRNVAQQATAVRLAPIDMRVRPLDTFLVGADEAERLAGPSAENYSPSGWGTGSYVLMAACRDYQLASEYQGDGKPRGAFSYFLNDVLRSTAAPSTYRDLFARTSALVQANVLDQTPQLEASNPSFLDSLFLDGTIPPFESAYTIGAKNGRWLLEAGAVHGLPRIHGTETIELALYPFDASAAVLRDRTRSIGKARVTKLHSTTSSVEISEISSLTDTMTFKAVITSLPLPALAVRIEGDNSHAVTLVRMALENRDNRGQASLYLREADTDELPEFRLLAQDGQYIITSPSSDRPLVSPIDGFTEANAARVIARLEHIARWTLGCRLTNPETTIQPAEIEFQILQSEKPLTGSEIRLSYTPKGGKSEPPRFTTRVKNNGQRILWVALLDFAQNYKISAELQNSGSTRLGPGEEFSPFGGQEISATIPDELWMQGVVEYRDILKLIVCTDEFDARLMAQPAIDLPRTEGRATRGLPERSLDRLMTRVQTRKITAASSANLDDWWTTSVTFTTVRPHDAATVPSRETSPLPLPGGVKLWGHSRFRGKARLIAATIASRHLGNLSFPRLLLDDPTTSLPFVLASTRSTDPGLSVLELTDVEPDSEQLVTPDQPLRLVVPQRLAPGENVLPIAFDGEFFLPLGRASSLSDGTTEVVLQRLPAGRAPGGTRSLQGAIQIFFQKVIGQRVVESATYPILAVADVAEDEAVVSLQDPAMVNKRVAPAQKILLFIHGIIGDTKDMAKSVVRAKLAEGGSTLRSRYDLILTYDYENLNTGIEGNARVLKQRLEAAGLGPNHGKTLHIAAHSTGGLVSRLFVEREGGDKVVQKLVMLGTPNGGLPWANVVDWATIALALGLNHLTVTPWAAKVVCWLQNEIERLKIDLVQMHTDSEVLKQLAQTPDPKIPYVMMAGTASLPPKVTEPDPAKGNTSILQRLLKSLRADESLKLAANSLFSGVQNDIAVSLESMRSLPINHTPPYAFREVACDHLTYFNTPAGLEGLLKALG
jgi:hypothetical protein